MNTPVMGDDGRIALIIHHVIDMTKHMRWRAPHWHYEDLSRPVKLDDSRGVLADHAARERDPISNAIRSSTNRLRDSGTVMMNTQAQIEDSRAQIAESMALLAKRVR